MDQEIDHNDFKFIDNSDLDQNELDQDELEGT